MILSFSDRAVIRLPVVMMNGQGEFISGEARSKDPHPKGKTACGHHLRQGGQGARGTHGQRGSPRAAGGYHKQPLVQKSHGCSLPLLSLTSLSADGAWCNPAGQPPPGAWNKARSRVRDWLPGSPDRTTRHLPLWLGPPLPNWPTGAALASSHQAAPRPSQAPEVFQCRRATSCWEKRARSRGPQRRRHATLLAFIMSCSLERLWAALLLWLMLVWWIPSLPLPATQ